MKLKILLYLSVVIMLLPSIFAIGDTFSIVQGSLESVSNIYFEVFSQEEFLFDSFQVQAVNGFYALSITIPLKYSAVELIPVVDGVKLDYRYEVHSGDVITIDIFPALNKNDSASNFLSSSAFLDNSFSFKPKSNEKKIKDISQGNFQAYEDEINISPLPSIKYDEVKQNLVYSSTEQPRKVINDGYKEVSNDVSLIHKINNFFLDPIVLVTLLLCSCVMVIIVIKRKMSEYL